MPIDLASVPAEDLLPVIALMERTPMEKRGEVTLRVQRAAREFLAKAEGAQRSAADAETDPVRKAVFGALAKQLPAPPPTLDPLRREALGTLVKAVTAGAKANLKKGVGALIGRVASAPFRAGGKIGARTGAKIGATMAAKKAVRTRQNMGQAIDGIVAGSVRGAKIGYATGAGAVAAGGAYAGSKLFGRKKKQDA